MMGVASTNKPTAAGRISPVRHRELMYGHHRIGRAQVYVNPGLGYSHRIRFLARPELTVFRLVLGAPPDMCKPL